MVCEYSRRHLRRGGVGKKGKLNCEISVRLQVEPQPRTGETQERQK